MHPAPKVHSPATWRPTPLQEQNRDKPTGNRLAASRVTRSAADLALGPADALVPPMAAAADACHDISKPRQRAGAFRQSRPRCDQPARPIEGFLERCRSMATKFLDGHLRRSQRMEPNNASHLPCRRNRQVTNATCRPGQDDRCLGRACQGCVLHTESDPAACPVQVRGWLRRNSRGSPACCNTTVQLTGISLAMPIA